MSTRQTSNEDDGLMLDDLAASVTNVGQQYNQQGLQVRHCSLEATADFEARTVNGVSVIDLSFPIDFRECSYQEAYELFCQKENEEIERHGFKVNLENRPTSLDDIPIDDDDLMDEADDWGIVNGHQEGIIDKAPTFCLIFHAPPSAVTTLTKITVNNVASSFCYRPHVDPATVARPGAIPYDAGDRHSLAEFDAAILAHLGEQWANDLLVALPVGVLRQQLQKAYRAVRRAAVRQAQEMDESGAEAESPPQQSASSLWVGNMAFSISVAIHFVLKDPSPLNSSLYFVNKVLRDPKSQKVKEYPLLLNSQRMPTPAGQWTWFPTVPYKVFSAVDSKGRFHYRVHWRLKFTVPQGYQCIAPGHHLGMVTKLVDTKLWDEHTFETRGGDYSSLLPSQIAFFAGPMSLWESTDDRMAPFQLTLDPLGEQSGRLHFSSRDDTNEEEAEEEDMLNEDQDVPLNEDPIGGMGWEASRPTEPSMYDMDGSMSFGHKPADEQTSTMVVEEGSDDELNGKKRLYVGALKGFEGLLKISLSHLPKALKAVCSYLYPPGEGFPGSQLKMVFLPISNNVDWNSPLEQNRTGGCYSRGDSISNSALNDRGCVPFKLDEFAPVSSLCSYGSRFRVFGNLIVFDISLLHDSTDNSEGIKFTKLAIVEGILAYWFGNLLDVPPSKLAEDYWLAVSLRKYFTFRIHQDLFGKVDATVWLKRCLDMYCRLVELGYDRTALSTNKNGINLGPCLDCCPVFDLKCSLIFPSLECLVVSTSNGRNWLPSHFFQYVVTGYIIKLLARFPKGPLSTEKLFDRLAQRGRAIFIKGKHHKTAIVAPQQESVVGSSVTGEHTFLLGGVEQPDVIALDGGTHVADDVTPATLDLTLYKGHATHDIGQWLQDIEHFQQAYIMGTGVCQVTVSMYCETQKKTSALESLRARVDQIPLQPPRLVNPKDEVSQFTPCVQAAIGVLGALLQHPDYIHMTGTSPTAKGTVEQDKQNVDDMPQNLQALMNLRSQLVQCSQPLQILEQIKFTLDSTVYHPIELVVRDNRCALGFGYLGPSTSPICGGEGPLFNNIVKQATSSWSNLTPEQRSVMASDTTAMESLVASTPAGVRIPPGATGGQPLWVAPLLAWQSYRSALTLTEVIPRNLMPVSALSSLADFASFQAWAAASDGLLNRASIGDNFEVELPESAGSTKFWPVHLRLKLFEETRIGEEDISLTNLSTPQVFTLRDASQQQASLRPSWLGLRRPGSSRASNSINRVLGVVTSSASLMVQGEQCRFQGHLAQLADVDMLNATCTESIRHLFAAGALIRQQGAAALDALVEAATNDGSTVGGDAAANRSKAAMQQGKPMPLLWVRLSEDSFNVVRSRRFQSLSMWIQQLLNDVCPIAQIEAAEAVGIMASNPSALDAIKTCICRPRIHPYVRGILALALAQQSRCESGTATEAATILLEDVLPLAQWPGINLARENVRQKVWVPPLYSTGSMIFLSYVLTAVSRVRTIDGETPDEVFTIFTSILESSPSPIDLTMLNTSPHTMMDETFPISKFIAYLIVTLRNLVFSEVPVSNAVLPLEVGWPIIQCYHESFVFWDFKWIDEKTEKLFYLLWQWFRMEQKFCVGPQVVTAAFLRLMASKPVFSLLGRKAFMSEKGLGFDPLRLFVPLVVVLPPDTHNAQLPKPKDCTSAYTYLDKFVVASTSLLKDADPVAFQSVFFSELVRATSMASSCLNYLDEAVVCEAMRLTLTLILEGRLLPPLYLINRSCAQILCSDFTLEDISRQVDGLYRDDIPIQSPLECQWVDSFAEQQYLMRSGLAVLFAIKLLCQLHLLLPFNDTHFLIPRSWCVMLECLHEAAISSPLTLLPFTLHTASSAAPVFAHKFASPVSKQRKGETEKKTVKHRKRVGERNHTVAPTATPLGNSSETDKSRSSSSQQKKKIVVPSFGGDSLPDDTPVLDTPVLDTSVLDTANPVVDEQFLAALDPSEGFPGESMDEWLEDSLMAGMDTEAAPSETQPTFQNEETHGSVMEAEMPGLEDGALPDEEGPVTADEGDPSVSGMSQPLRGSKKKRKKKPNKSFVEWNIDAPVVIPPTVAAFELALGYIHTCATATLASSSLHVSAVRDVITFLFGDCVPRCVSLCRATLDRGRRLLAEEDLAELARVDQYIAENYRCLTDPKTHNAKGAAKMLFKAIKSGMSLRHIASYEKSYINVWLLSQRPQTWPLPLDIEWKSLALRLTQCLMEHPSALWFIHAVDPNETPNYYKVIEHPIWLSKVLEKLKAKEYQDFEHWKSDIFRIFRNCRTFNAPHTVIIQDCDAVQSLAYQLLHFAERLLTPFQMTIE